jgi:hypothetical protein
MAAKKTPTKPKRAAGKLAPRREKRGLSAAQIPVAGDAPELAEVSVEVTGAGGAIIGAYREPLSALEVIRIARSVAAPWSPPSAANRSDEAARERLRKLSLELVGLQA